MLKWLLMMGFLLVLSGYEVVGWAVESGPLEETVTVLIPRGANSAVVARELDTAGIIDKPWLFRLVAKAKGLEKKLKAGEYVFGPQVSLVDAMNKIARGEILYRKITLPEGLTSAQMLELIRNEPMLNGEINLQLNEGEILPETYSFIRGDSRESVVTQAQKAMQLVLQKAWVGRDESLPLKTPTELLILASIVEKETGIPEERSLVAAVFVNRLQKRMLLQTDPTVIYAITRGQNELGRSLTRKDLQVDDRYNTYKYAGLPPTPICNPGKEAIYAAAKPEVSDYIYFVANGNGGHSFAKNLKEHNQNVQNWRKMR